MEDPAAESEIEQGSNGYLAKIKTKKMACHGLTAEVQEVIEKDGTMQDILKYLDQEEN